MLTSMRASSVPSTNLRKLHLPRAQQWLFEQCQCVDHGSITIFVRGGEPDLARPYRTVRTLRLSGRSNGPRPEAALADFALRNEHLALLAGLKEFPDGTCVKVKVAHGLPGSTIDIEEEHKAA